MTNLAHSLVGAALRLAETGWFVLALLEHSKAPGIPRGVKNASRDPAQIEHWWRRRPFNIGVAAGAVSGFTVVDVDGAEALEALLHAALPHGGLPTTVTSRTPHGHHLYFDYVPGLSNRVRVPQLRVDVRNDGGYVVAPPSRLSVTELYSWIRSPWTTRLAPMPAWLAEQLRPRSTTTSAPCGMPQKPRSIGANTRYGRGALRREAERLSTATVGTRNDALNQSAYRMGALIEPCGLPEAEVRRQLVAACDANGLLRDDGQHAVERTIASGLRAGRANPRRLPELAR